tara:strand:- start:269 stop:1291 length:1023 start_codon:yes stop_codon:yes gene_type:complete
MLKDKIIKIINKKSFIYLDEFLKIAHQDEKLGYYTTQNPIGKKGDFITAPEVSQLYGEIIALKIIHKVKQNKIKRFELIELGPGKGTLMRDIIRVFNKSLEKEIDYSVNFVEINKKYRSELINEFSNSKILYKIKNLGDNYSIFIANEFFDCLPMSQISLVNGELYETTIKVKNKSKLVFDKSSARKNIVYKIGHQLKEGEIYEYSEETIQIFNEIAEIIKNTGGYLLIADYGYIKPNMINSLQSLKDNKYTEVLSNIGKQDITYHVNFIQLLNVAKKHDLKNINISSQSNFLQTNGINLRAEKLIVSNPKFKNKILDQLSRLTDQDKMGKLFKIFEAEY